MKFLDLDGVQAFKAYNDSVYITAEDVDTVDPVPRDTYTKDEIDENNEVISAALNDLNSRIEDTESSIENVVNTIGETEIPSVYNLDGVDYYSENKKLYLTSCPQWVNIVDKPTVRTSIRTASSASNTDIVSEKAISSALSAKEATSNKVTSLSNSSTNTQYPSAKCVYDALQTKLGQDEEQVIASALNVLNANKENVSNKVTSISSTSTDNQYPSALAVYEALQDAAGGGDENVIEDITFNGSSVPISNKTAQITGQATLVSGVNIKTINNESILGSGNITITGGGMGEENVIEVVKVNGTALTPDANKAVDITVPTESTVSGWGFTKNTGTYSKPSGGIPATDLTSAVQTSLGKADTALQSYTETDPVYSASAAAGITSSDITSWNNKVSNVQSDWNATSGAAVILNKPTIPNDSGLVHTTGNETIGGTKTITGTLSFGGSEGGTNSKIVLDEDSEVNMYFATMNLTNSSINTIASDWSNIIRKATANGTATTLQQDLDAKQNAITSTNKLDYSLLTNTPTIPTESTVSGWGFTKNAGTVTGVKMNGTTKTPTSGTVDLGTVITSETSLSKGTTTGGGNAVTDISVSGHTITLTKGSTFLTSETQLSKGTTSGSGNVVTDLSVSGHTVTLTKGSTVPVATSANAGKIPMITSSGGWEYVTPSAIYSGSATPNNNTGNNGDIYLQM